MRRQERRDPEISIIAPHAERYLTIGLRPEARIGQVGAQHLGDKRRIRLSRAPGQREVIALHSEPDSGGVCVKHLPQLFLIVPAQSSGNHGAGADERDRQIFRRERKLTTSKSHPNFDMVPGSGRP